MDKKPMEDFPIDWEQDDYISRREFFKFMTLASGGLALSSVMLATLARFPRESRKFERLRIAREDEIPVGASLAFSYPRSHDLCILIRRRDGSLAAFSRRCTHLSCPVDYQPENNRLYCPCHDGAFSIVDGSVLKGPPPRPLPQVILEVVDGEVYATGVTLGEGVSGAS